MTGGSLGEGAAQAAPTAPHATPRARGAKRTGPERFWSHGPTRVALGVGLALSLVAHGSAFPLEWPATVDVHDVDGEASIAVDLLQASGVDTPPEPPPPPVETPEPPVREKTSEAPSASARAADAGAHRIATREARDAASDEPIDGGVLEGGEADGGVFEGGEADGGVLEGGDLSDAPSAGVLASRAVDAGADSGAGDTQAIAGAAGAVQADVVLVVVLVNAEVIRKNSVGRSLGYLLRGIPQWADFMGGTDIDPVRDTDWLMISGPSLVNTGRDVVLIRYGATDAAVDHAIAIVTRKYTQGGPFDAGVPGVKATLAHADRAERVLLRAGPHVLALVPPSVASKVARQLVTSRLPAHVLPGQAVYFRFVSPHRAVPEIPESISELRLRVIPRSDDGADAFLEGDATDAETAAEVAPEMARAIQRRNGFLVSTLTHGLLDRVEVRAEGARVLVHLSANVDQLETLASFAASYLGVEMPEGPAPSASGARPKATERAPTKNEHRPNAP